MTRDKIAPLFLCLLSMAGLLMIFHIYDNYFVNGDVYQSVRNGISVVHKVSDEGFFAGLKWSYWNRSWKGTITSWATIPFLFGGVEQALRVSAVVWSLIFTAYLYRCLLLCLPPWRAMVATLILTTLGSVFSELTMPESYLLSMVGGVGFIVHLNLALRLRSFNHTAIAGLFAALGLMTRPAEILLLGAPSLLLLYFTGAERKQLVQAAGVALGIAAAWWLPNFAQLYDYFSWVLFMHSKLVGGELAGNARDVAEAYLFSSLPVLFLLAIPWGGEWVGLKKSLSLRFPLVVAASGLLIVVVCLILRCYNVQYYTIPLLPVFACLLIFALQPSRVLAPWRTGLIALLVVAQIAGITLKASDQSLGYKAFDSFPAARSDRGPHILYAQVKKHMESTLQTKDLFVMHRPESFQHDNRPRTFMRIFSARSAFDRLPIKIHKREEAPASVMADKWQTSTNRHVLLFSCSPELGDDRANLEYLRTTLKIDPNQIEFLHLADSWEVILGKRENEVRCTVSLFVDG